MTRVEPAVGRRGGFEVARDAVLVERGMMVLEQGGAPTAVLVTGAHREEGEVMVRSVRMGMSRKYAARPVKAIWMAFTWLRWAS